MSNRVFHKKTSFFSKTNRRNFPYNLHKNVSHDKSMYVWSWLLFVYLQLNFSFSITCYYWWELPTLKKDQVRFQLNWFALICMFSQFLICVKKRGQWEIKTNILEMGTNPVLLLEVFFIFSLCWERERDCTDQSLSRGIEIEQ